MKKIFLRALFLIIAAAPGCLWGKANPPQVIESAPVPAIGRIVDSSLLKKGGALLIAPFKAGVDAEAGEQLDKISLRIVKGVADALQENNAPFQILVADNAQEADVVLKGFIEKIGSSGTMKRWILRKREIDMRVQGRMMDVKTGRLILMFSFQRKIKGKTKDYNSLAYEMGKELGMFILP